MSGSLARQALSVLTNRWLLNACNFVTFVILARVLTSADFGVYGVFTSAVFLVEAAGNLGLRQASAHQIGQQALTDGEALGASLAVWPVSALVCGLLVWWSMLSVVDGASAASWLLPSLLATFGVVLASLCQGVFLGRGQIRNFNTIEIVPRLILLAGVLLLSLMGWAGITEQAWLFAASFAITAVLGLVLARPEAGARLQFRRTALVQLLRSGWPFALTLFLIMLNTRVSVFILSGRLEPAASGQYFAALRLNDLILQTASAIGLVLFSHGTRAKDAQLALAQAAQVTRWLIWATLLATIAGILLAPWLVPLMLGASYAPTVPALQILLLALPMASLTKVIYPTLAGLGRPLLGAAVLGPAVVLNAGLSYALALSHGVMGAAIALGISQTIIAIVFLILSRRIFGVPIRDFIWPRRSEFAGVATRVKARIPGQPRPPKGLL